jgi:hypothetical protein
MVPIRVNWIQDGSVRKVADAIRASGLPLHAVYLSNAEDYWKIWPQPFINNVLSLPSQPDSVWLRTTATGEASVDLRFSVQKLADFQAWMKSNTVFGTRPLIPRQAYEVPAEVQFTRPLNGPEESAKGFALKGEVLTFNDEGHLFDRAKPAKTTKTTSYYKVRKPPAQPGPAKAVKKRPAKPGGAADGAAKAGAKPADAAQPADSKPADGQPADGAKAAAKPAKKKPAAKKPAAKPAEGAGAAGDAAPAGAQPDGSAQPAARPAKKKVAVKPAVKKAEAKPAADGTQP